MIFALWEQYISCESYLYFKKRGEYFWEYSIFHPRRQPLGKYERHSLNPNWARGVILNSSLTYVMRQTRVCGLSSEGCMSSITIMLLIWDFFLNFFFVKHYNKETRKRGIIELHSHTTQVWVVGVERKRGVKEVKGHTMQVNGGYRTHGGSKNSRVTQHTFWVVRINVSMARTLQTSFGKSQTGLVTVAR